MTTLAKLRAVLPTEHEEQVRLFQWAGLAAGRYPELAEMFAVPNGGHRHAAVAGKLKAEGVKPGVEDVMLLVPREPYHGLLIEMKRQRSVVSDVKPAQRAWHEIHRSRGYCVWVCDGFEDARQAILDYLSA